MARILSYLAHLTAGFNPWHLRKPATVVQPYNLICTEVEPRESKVQFGVSIDYKTPCLNQSINQYQLIEPNGLYRGDGLPNYINLPISNMQTPLPNTFKSHFAFFTNILIDKLCLSLKMRLGTTFLYWPPGVYTMGT